MKERERPQKKGGDYREKRETRMAKVGCVQPKRCAQLKVHLPAVRVVEARRRIRWRVCGDSLLAARAGSAASGCDAPPPTGGGPCHLSGAVHSDTHSFACNGRRSWPTARPFRQSISNRSSRWVFDNRSTRQNQGQRLPRNSWYRGRVMTPRNQRITPR